MSRTIPITGISGLLGGSLGPLCTGSFDRVVGLYHGHPVSIPGVDALCQDLTDYPGVRELVTSVDPDVVVHCASRTDVDGMEDDPEGAWRANVLTTRNIVDALRDVDSRLVYISTDSVYEGTVGNYSEEMAGHAQNVYGKTKLEGERVVAARPGSLILRTNIFGRNTVPKLSLAEWFIEKLQKGETVAGFSDVAFSSLYTRLFGEVLLKCLSKGISGTYNCASRDNMTKLEFGRQLADRFGAQRGLVVESSIGTARLRAARGRNLTLDVTRLEAELGEELPTMRESLDAFRRDWEKEDGLGRGQALFDGIREHYPQGGIISYGRQYIDRADIDSVVSVLKSSNLTQGRRVDEFEQGIRRVCGSDHAVAVSSGTAALHLACLACGVEPGHEVVTSPNTFVASANCAAYCGAKPVFTDIDPRTFNMLPESLADNITPRTRAVIPVHFAGQSCDMEAIKEIVAEKERLFGTKIYIVEDASHALGGRYSGQAVGGCRYSDMAVFSLHPVKHITTGEGGVVTSNDADLAEELLRLRSHGVVRTPDICKEHGSWYYEQVALGFNYRITDMQCALGCSQLEKLDWFKRRRRHIVQRYNEAFGKAPHLVTPYESPKCESNFHLYVALFDFRAMGMSRSAVMEQLRRSDILTQVHYIPVYRQPFHKNLMQGAECVRPNMDAYYERCLSLPLYPSLSDRDVDSVISKVTQMAEGKL